MTDDLRTIPGASDPEAEALLVKAVRCRRLAAQTIDLRAAAALKALAEECESRVAGMPIPSRACAA